MLNILFNIFLLILIIIVNNRKEHMTDSTELNNKRLRVLKLFSEYNINDGKIILNDYSCNLLYLQSDFYEKSSLFTQGMIVPYAGTSIPRGWALCDGTNGTPNLKNKFIVGAGQGIGLTERILGQTGGEETHTLTIQEIPNHTHNYLTTDAGSKNVDPKESNRRRWHSRGNVVVEDILKPAESDKNNTVTTGQPHNNMPPYVVLRYIMKL